MIPRSPRSPEGAFKRVVEIIGVSHCAELLGVCENMVYRYTMSQHVSDLSFLNVSLAMAMDAMCKEKTGETPLLDFFQQRLGAKQAPVNETLETAAIELARDVGEVEGEILSMREARVLSNRKIIDLHASLQKVRKCVAGMETIVDSAGKPA